MKWKMTAMISLTILWSGALVNPALAQLGADGGPTDVAEEVELVRGGAFGDPTPMEQLGAALFFDENLSTPPGQSCAACHGPAAGWTGPVEAINEGGSTYPGAVHVRFGGRKPPSAAYGALSPILHYDEDEGLFIGGMFWDGRATGEELGDPLADQAIGPFLNPLEQNNPNARRVCTTVRSSGYAWMFQLVWGELDCLDGVDEAYARIGLSIAAYEASVSVNPFDSKYDHYLWTCVAAGHDKDACANGAGLKAVLDPLGIFTDQEWVGLQLFVGANDNDGTLEMGEGANCAACHVTEWDGMTPPVFTDFTYDNLGVPRNPMNEFYSQPPRWNPLGEDWIDLGLGAYLQSTVDYAHLAAENYGKVKVPTLRNVDLRPYEGFVKAFGHNGVFKSLEEITHFYSTRDLFPVCDAGGTPGVDCWPPPEYAENVNDGELGSLALTDEMEAALVAFMGTLSDGFQP
jgi:cytochrome c peroxidase